MAAECPDMSEKPDLPDLQPFPGMCFRRVNLTVMTSVVEDAMELHRDFPDIMAGFDTVREDER